MANANINQRLHRFSYEDRDLHWKDLENTTFDLCVIGGGITGAGVARDAASRGLSVCVLEQNDFASGTSSRSSKLIHGGIRYLENLEFGLVFEALNERHILFEIAPHLVHPLTFILPLYKGGRVGMFKMGLGMWLYDLLALMHAPRLHERMSPAMTLAHVPSLQHHELLGSFIYSDAYMDDDRLVLETLRSAHAFGAVSLNYVKAGRGHFNEKDRLTTLEVTDRQKNRVSQVKARHFISTVGPWTDQFAESLFPWKKILRPSKGIHLTFRRDRLQLNDAVVMAADKEKRIIFAIPRHEMIIIGTTDTDYPGDPGQVHSDASDVDYLMHVIHQYFPQARISESDVVASYAGVRPLVFDNAQSESATSREHVITSTPRNVTFVAGGKYTTYRRMARDIVEHVLKREFSLEDQIKFARNNTRQAINPLVTSEKLKEAIAWSETWAKEFQLAPKETLLLCERHGVEAYDILTQGKSLNLKTSWEMEAAFAVRNTMCLHFRDFMLRRTPLFLAESNHGYDKVDALASVFQKMYGWDSKTLEQEKVLYADHLKFEMSWRKS